MGYDTTETQSPWDMIPFTVTQSHGIWYYGDSISLGYDTTATQSPWGMIPRRLNHPGIWYHGDSISLGYDITATQSPWDMIPQRLNLPGIWYHGDSFSLGYDITATQSPWDMIPRRCLRLQSFHVPVFLPIERFKLFNLLKLENLLSMNKSFCMAYS